MADQSEKEELLSRFVSVSGVDRERALFYLESSGWQLNVALSTFYEEGPEEEDIPETLTSGQPAEANEGGKVQESFSSSAESRTQTSGRQTSRFATLSDMRRSEEDSSSEDEGQRFYAGGSDHGSGQQIVGPKKKKKDADKIVAEMFEKAKEHGAEEVSAGASAGGQRAGGPSFRGAGYRLGDTEGPISPVAGTAGRAIFTPPQEIHVKLNLWKNGFSVDDGELRAYEDPKNADFLTSIKRGEIPLELIKLAKGGEVNLDMEDQRNEDYVKPKVKLQVFSGAGHKLGSPAPTVVSQPTAASGGASGASGNGDQLAQDSLNINSSQPLTSLQLRLADGTRLVGKFNHTHTVGDIRRFIEISRPQFNATSFALMTTFPNKELMDDSQSIKEANLLNAVIVQRVK